MEEQRICQKKGCPKKKVPQSIALFEDDRGSTCKTCKTCRDLDKHRRNRTNVESEPEPKPKKSRSEAAKKQSLHYYGDTCPITGAMGPAVEGAHIVPKDENDTWQNIVPMSADIHREYDATHPLWSFDPNTKTTSSRPGYIKLRIVHSDKGNFEKCRIKDYNGEYEIREESLEFVWIAYRRFMNSEFPEVMIEDVS